MNTGQDREDGNISGINVTPLVDVSLVLVLIFIVTSPFFVKNLIQVRIPTATSATSEDEENITVSITAGEEYAVNEAVVQKEDLAVELSRQKEESNLSFLLIRADEKVAHGDVLDVLKLGKKMGFRRIAFATVPPIR